MKFVILAVTFLIATSQAQAFWREETQPDSPNYDLNVGDFVCYRDAWYEVLDVEYREFMIRWVTLQRDGIAHIFDDRIFVREDDVYLYRGYCK